MNLINFKTRLKPRALIDITPLIDFAFLLVFFFMVTSTIGRESSITIQLPKAIQTADSKKEGITVSVNKENRIFIGDDEVTKDNFISVLKQKKQNSEDVLIRGDRKASYETIVFVMDSLNQAGVAGFSIATED